MNIIFPKFPSDLMFTLNGLNYRKLIINKKTFPCPASLLIFYIYSGKYINGYDINGKKIFSYKIPLLISHIIIESNNIIFML